MAVGTPVGLDAGDDTSNVQTYASMSITPSANTIVIAAINHGKSSSPPNTPHISGCGLTWSGSGTTPFGTLSYNTVGTPVYTLSLYWGVGASPTTGVVTFDGFGANQNGLSYSIFEVPGCDLASPIVAASVVSNRGDAGTTASVAMNTIASADNGLIALVGLDASTAITQRTNWFEIHDQLGAAPAKQTETAYRLGVDDDASATFSSADWGIIAFELAAASGAPAPTSMILRPEPMAAWLVR